MRRRELKQHTQDWLDQQPSGLSQITLIAAAAAAMLLISTVCIQLNLI